MSSFCEKWAKQLTEEIKFCLFIHVRVYSLNQFLKTVLCIDFLICYRCTVILAALNFGVTNLLCNQSIIQSFQDSLRALGEQEKIGLLKEKDDALRKYNELNDQVKAFACVI